MPRYIDANNVKLKGVPVFDQNLEILVPLSDVRKALQMTPTEDVQEVRHGRWIRATPYSQDYCNKCGLTPKMIFGKLPPFCPNCGAKMDGWEGIRNGQRKTD